MEFLQPAALSRHHQDHILIIFMPLIMMIDMDTIQLINYDFFIFFLAQTTTKQNLTTVEISLQFIE